MASTFTTNKNLELPGNGDYVDTWNVPVNADMNVIDAALGGVTNLSSTSGTIVLTDVQYRNLILNITGTLVGNMTYTVPNGVGGQWIVRNATSGAFTVTIASGGGGTSLAVTQGAIDTVYSDGTNIRTSKTIITSVTPIAQGGTGATNATDARTNLGLGSVATENTVPVAKGGTGATTLAANNVLLGNGTGAVQAVAPGASGNLLTSNGTTWTSAARASYIVSDAPVASTSGTNIDFTNIPSWARRVTVIFSLVSFNGYAHPRIQIGASTFVTSGYSGCGSVTQSTSATSNFSSGFDVYTNGTAPTYQYSGIMTLCLIDASSNTWCASGTASIPGFNLAITFSGSVSLSGSLQRVRATSSDGFSSFDGGVINVFWE